MSRFKVPRPGGLPSKNHVILYDKKTRIREVTCREGMLVQDVLNQACLNLDPSIAPIGRFFFGLKDMKTHCYLSPYLPVPAGNHRYQLRVFVSPAQGNFQFQTVSRSLLNYYYHQLKEDFVHGSLYPPVSVNNAIWMVAADMAKEAAEKNKTFSEFSHPEILRLSSPSLKEKWREDDNVVEMLESIFTKFLEAYERFRTGEGGDNFPDHFHCRYLEIYEQDDHCGTHLFQLKHESPFPQSSFARRSREAVVILAVSPKKGLYKFNFKGKKQADNKYLCRIVDISAVTLDDVSLVATVECFDRTQQDSRNHKLHFKTKDDLLSFFTVLDAYFRIKVDANSSVLSLESSSLSPPPLFPNLPNKDLFYAPICHDAVQEVLAKFDTPEGYFLVRQSRSHENSFVLSLCHGKRVLNFRIIQYGNGSVSLCNPRQGEEGGTDSELTFATLLELVDSHKTLKAGLPILLTMNCCPNVTGPIPLIPAEREEDTDLEARPISTSTSMSSQISRSPTPPPPLPSHIQDLIDKGVKYIEYQDVHLDVELGSGHFSTVYKGTWGDKQVAVKVPSGLTTVSAQLVMTDLTREIEVMSRLEHPHIVKLFGITHAEHFVNCLKTVMMVVMEFVEGGSLSSYLEKLKRGASQQQVSLDTILRNKKLNFMTFSFQIAEAMEYLGDRKLVHRDLATRNVLVVSPTEVKVSDFGLARQFKDDKNYYPASQNKDVPIFWFAPECLQAPQKFTNKSDVWSYGVTLWELFSLGNNPKQFLAHLLASCKSSADVFKMLVDYYKQPTNRLPMRPPLPPEVYELLKECWAFHPVDRPSFAEIKDRISSLY